MAFVHSTCVTLSWRVAEYGADVQPNSHTIAEVLLLKCRTTGTGLADAEALFAEVRSGHFPDIALDHHVVNAMLHAYGGCVPCEFSRAVALWTDIASGVCHLWLTGAYDCVPLCT